MIAIEATGLHKSFGKVKALDGLDLSVPRGSVCALLGPNGAGKTTAVRILATLARPDAGTARVAGHDPIGEPRRVRELIGLAGQHAAVDEDLTGRENLFILGLMHHLGRRGARTRAGELLEQFGLAEAADRLGSRINVVVADQSDLPAAAAVVEPLTSRTPHVEAGERRLSASVAGGAASGVAGGVVTLPELVRLLDAAGVAAEDVSLRRPTLDEVFLDRTGRDRTHDEEAAA